MSYENKPGIYYVNSLESRPANKNPLSKTQLEASLSQKGSVSICIFE